MMVRLLCEARDEQTARETSGALFNGIQAALAEQPALKKRVLYCREDDAPIKKIMGRARAQVLLKVLVHPDSDRVLLHLKSLAEQAWPCTVTLEIDPASMA
jgi:primosomal protein N'